MKRFRLRKLMAAVGTLMLVLIASSSYADQYEAISTDSRSLRYTNTFGHFYNDYDFLVNPRLLGHTQGQRVVTNLTNLDDENEFQLGYGGPLGPGNIAGIVSVGGRGEDSSDSESYVEFRDDMNDDDVDDTKEIETETTGYYNNNSNLDGYLGYGYLLNKDTGVGAGVGYNRNTKENRYWDPYEDGFPGADYSIGPMYIWGFIDLPDIDMANMDFDVMTIDPDLVSRDILVTDLETGEVLAQGNESLDGTMKETNNEIDLLLGADRKLGPKLTASADVIIGFGSQKNEGEGTYTANIQVPDAAIWEASITSSLNQTFNSIRRYGVAVEGQYAADPRHLVHINLGFEQSPGKIKESEYTLVYNERYEDFITGEIITDTETYQGERSGNDNKTTYLMLSIWDNYTVSDIISLGFGGEFGWAKISDDYTDSGTYDSIEVYDDNGIYGDNPGNDWTETESASMSREVNDETNYLAFAFPVTAIVKVTKKLELRLGGRYTHLITNREVKDNLASYEGLTSRRVYGDGRVVEDTSPPSEKEYEDASIVRAYEGVESVGDIRVGLGYEPSENFELELLMASEGLTPYDEFDPFSFDAGNYEGSRIDRAYLSGTLKFK